MKKIFTLIVASFLTVAMFAADRKPVVTLKTSRNYEIVIDGQSYFSGNSIMNISNIRNGQHSIKVYEVSKGFMFRKAKRLVDASSFQLRNNDIAISVDFRGQINISENRFNQDRRNDQGNNGRDNNYGYDTKNSHGQNSQDQNSHDKNYDNGRNGKGNRF